MASLFNAQDIGEARLLDAGAGVGLSTFDFGGSVTVAAVNAPDRQLDLRLSNSSARIIGINPRVDRREYAAIGVELGSRDETATDRQSRYQDAYGTERNEPIKLERCS